VMPPGWTPITEADAALLGTVVEACVARGDRLACDIRTVRDSAGAWYASAVGAKWLELHLAYFADWAPRGA